MYSFIFQFRIKLDCLLENKIIFFIERNCDLKIIKNMPKTINFNLIS